MNMTMTAGFESFEKADKALSKIRDISKSIYCAENTAENTQDLDSPPFVVPISPDYFRLCPIANNNAYIHKDCGAKINIFADCKYEKDIEKIIRRHNGSIESKALIKQ